MLLDLTSLTKAVNALHEALQVASTIDFSNPAQSSLYKVVQSGVIQNFEVAYEVSWKMMKRWIELNVSSVVVDGVSRRELFRLAAESTLIVDVDKWMTYHQCRNLTSHTYDTKRADEVYSLAKAFLNDARQVLGALEARNDQHRA